MDILFSTAALVISLFTLWRAYLTPFRLLITPPALHQVNDENPSLIMDIAFCNEGSRTALISNLTIRTLDSRTELSLKLCVQNELDRFQKGPLPLVKEEGRAFFVPFVVRGGQSEVKRFLFSPFLKEEDLSLADILLTNALSIEMLINGRWYTAFVVAYDGFREKFKQNGSLIIPEHGFSIRYYHTSLSPITIKGPTFRFH